MVQPLKKVVRNPVTCKMKFASTFLSYKANTSKRTSEAITVYFLKSKANTTKKEQRDPLDYFFCST
jgi:hypothetical protein